MIGRVLRREGMAPGLLIAVMVGGWVRTFADILVSSGLFGWMGGDYAGYRAQAELLLSKGASALYDVDALRAQLQTLTVFTTTPSIPLEARPVAYPPLFTWLFTGFARVPEPWAFALWTLLNLLAGVYLAWRASQFFPARRRWWVAGLVLMSLPVMYALLFGQAILPLACAFAEAYFAFREGKDFRAGLWISCLVIKPQYGLIIGPMLLLKRRWGAVLGAATGAIGILGASALLVGPSALASYPSSLHDLSSFNGVGDYVYAPDMVNWRGIILRIAPNVSDHTGVLAVLVLGLITVVASLYAWRGPWQPQSPRFAAQMVVLVLATVLANYHSHAHGASLLAVPLAALLAQAPANRLVAPLTLALVALPGAVYFRVPHVAGMAAWPLSLSMLALMGVLVWDLRRQERFTAEAWPLPAPPTDLKPMLALVGDRPDASALALAARSK